MVVGPKRKSVSPRPEETELARSSKRKLSPFVSRNLRLRIAETRETVVLPAPAVRLLVDALSRLAQGDAVTLNSRQAQMTTQQAADLLGVSRPFLVKQLDEGRIAHQKVGRHRRVLLADLLVYQRNMQRQRLAALEQLTQQAQKLKMGY